MAGCGGEDQQLRADDIGPGRLSAELQDTAHLGGIGEIGKCAQVHVALRLNIASRAAHEVPLPVSGPPPDHGEAVTPVEIMELDLRTFRSVGPGAMLPIREVRKQTAGHEIPGSAVRNEVRTRTGEQYRGLAARIGAGQNRDGILEGYAKVPDAAQLPYANFRQSIVALAAVGTQGVPYFVKLPVDQRHDWISPYSSSSSNSLACSAGASILASRLISGQLCTSPL